MRTEKKAGRRFITKQRIVRFLLMLYDVCAVNAAYFIALWLRFDCAVSEMPAEFMSRFFEFVPIYTVFCVLIFSILRLYRSIWRFVGYSEFLRTVAASAITGVFHAAAMPLLFGRMPISYYFVGAAIQFIAVLGVRFSYRFILMEQRRMSRQKNGRVANVMLIGAGAAGQIILRDIERAKELDMSVKCIIDDNSAKWNRYIDSVPIVGGREDIMKNVEKYSIDTIFVAIPSAPVEKKRDILNICNETGCEIKTLPGMYQLVNGEVSIADMKDVAVEDLLGREQISVSMDEIFLHLSGKTILVTGGGGSIGSELCRQIASHSPKRLIIFDIYENNAYDIEQELKRKYPKLNLTVLIGSVRDSRRIGSVFEEYKPDIVYHAAAHKHVPLMEVSPCEAIKNNAIGTYKTAYAAMMNGCRRFVLISTDKAVNPTNIMGASKRLCEMIIQSFDKAIKEGDYKKIPRLFVHREDGDGNMLGIREADARPRTEFVAVRFGNVLGSNGSVIPLFKKQIENGGPVTVTHPDIIRYFMTIPEAVSLVLQAGTYAKGGEIFVLDMGEPVKIDTLARNLIKLSGHKPDVDIKIEYTGLRPGEKLFEEKLMEEEGMKTTPNHLIHIGKPIPFDSEKFFSQMEKLMKVCYENHEDVRALVHEMVDTYTEADNAYSQSAV